MTVVYFIQCFFFEHILPVTLPVLFYSIPGGAVNCWFYALTTHQIQIDIELNTNTN